MRPSSVLFLKIRTDCLWTKGTSPNTFVYALVDDDIVIIARTDALQGFGLDEAVARLKAAVEAGADVLVSGSGVFKAPNRRAAIAALAAAEAPTLEVATP